MKIVTDKCPDSYILRLEAKPVTVPLSAEDKKLAYDMLEYLKVTKDEQGERIGVGIAAPQVGITKQLIVIYTFEGDKEIKMLLANPKITQYSTEKCYLRNGEGCLSVVDNHPGVVFRAKQITVQAYDIEQEKEVTIVTTLPKLSIILQHEIDHLNGILYYNKINKLKFIPKQFEAI